MAYRNYSSRSFKSFPSSSRTGGSCKSYQLYRGRGGATYNHVCERVYKPASYMKAVREDRYGFNKCRS
jgi:hypothetical protein